MTLMAPFCLLVEYTLFEILFPVVKYMGYSITNNCLELCSSVEFMKREEISEEDKEKGLEELNKFEQRLRVWLCLLTKTGDWGMIVKDYTSLK